MTTLLSIGMLLLGLAVFGLLYKSIKWFDKL